MALLDRAHGRRLHRRPGSCRSTGRSATSRTSRAARRSSARRSCWAASAPGRCTRAQIAIAKKVFSPDPDEVKFAKKVIEAIPDGRGVHMIDGKMQDDATWKQCQVMVHLAEMLAARTRSWPRPTASAPPASVMTGPRPRELGFRARMRFFEYEAREIVKRAGHPRHRLRLHDRRRRGAGDRRAHRRPDRHQVAGAHRRAHEGRRREVRRHARGGRGSTRADILAARDQRPHAARRARRPQGRGRAGVLRRRRLGRHRASSR